MALTAAGCDLQPVHSNSRTQSNYINNFDFLNQYLPDTYEKEFERYGNRTISSFLRMVGAKCLLTLTLLSGLSKEDYILNMYK